MDQLTSLKMADEVGQNFVAYSMLKLKTNNTG